MESWEWDERRGWLVRLNGFCHFVAMTEPLLSFTWRVWCLTPRLDRYYVRIVWRTIASALGGCNHIVARITSRLITFSTHCRLNIQMNHCPPPTHPQHRRGCSTPPRRGGSRAWWCRRAGPSPWCPRSSARPRWAKLKSDGVIDDGITLINDSSFMQWRPFVLI